LVVVVFGRFGMYDFTHAGDLNKAHVSDFWGTEAGIEGNGN
jgi:hypothetical protein